MGTEKSGTIAGKRWLRLGLELLCAVAVMAAAVLVRLPSSQFRDVPEARREAYTSESGIPYLTDMDSYYHVRLVQNYLDYGRLGDTVREDGSAWDSLRYYPEGSGANYQPGIVWLTAAAWRVFGGSLELLEYRLAAVLAALSALAAYLIGRRIGGIAGGLTAGLLTGCGPTYAMRTCFGRFDTDVFVIVMELLLILFLTGALRPGTWRKRAAYLAGFALACAASCLCWSPTYAAMFIGLTLVGGAAAVPVMIFADPQARPKTAGAFFRRPEILAFLAGGFLAAAGLLIVAGPSAFGGVLSTLFSFSTSSQTGEGVLPNLFASISELSRAAIFPGKAGQAFSGYVAGESPSAVNGIGGLGAFLLALAGLGCLVLSCFSRFREKIGLKAGKDSAVYACVLGVWLAAALFLTRYGVRFIEHLSIPVGLLAAGFAGLVTRRAAVKAADPRRKKKEKRRIPYGRLIAGALCAAALVPALAGAARGSADSRPSVSDASADAMRFIQERAQDGEAVVASWWDMGYFYTNESGHPTLWDGGSQNGARALLVSRALVADDLELSRRILLMLASSGNAAVDLLTQYTDPKTAFETIWEALLLDRGGATELLRSRCALEETVAEEAEALLHPAEPKETYLAITYTMTQQIGWYEYYAGWDFTGSQALPAATLYSYTPDGTPLFDTANGQEYLSGVRGNEAMWQLFFGAVQTPCFTPAFEAHDGMEHVRIWRVEP